MNSDWEQVNQLFHQALSVDLAERNRLLARINQENPAIGREVASLLAMNEENRSFMEVPALQTSLSPEFGRWQRQIVAERDSVGAGPLAVNDRMIGQLLDGKYEIEALCGRGGMGSVYRATHTGTGRRVAVKIIAPELAGDREFIDRFRQEARIIGLLHHPNIVDVTDFGVADHSGETWAYLVMEYLEGQTLADRLKNRRPMPLDETIAILAQICEAIDEAHRLGILHRDLKPENIWLESTAPTTSTAPKAKVLDFGIARLQDRLTIDDRELRSEFDDDPFSRPPLSVVEAETLRMNYTVQQLSRYGSVIGTPKYMSPEQCRGERTDKSSDIYSLGVIAYQMLDGNPPFVGSIPELLVQHRELDPEPLHEKRRKVPAAVDAVVQRALAKDRSLRPETAGAFAYQLLLSAYGNEWIQPQIDDLYHKHRWKFLALAIRTQWKGFVFSLTLLGLAMTLPGLPALAALVIFGLLWLLILTVTIRGQIATTDAYSRLVDSMENSAGSEPSVCNILRGVRSSRRIFTPAALRNTMNIPLRPGALRMKFRGLFTSIFLPPTSKRVGSGAEVVSACLTQGYKTFQRAIYLPMVRRALSIALVLTALQVILLGTAWIADGAGGFNFRLQVLRDIFYGPNLRGIFYGLSRDITAYLIMMLITGVIAFRSTLKNALEHAVFSLAARKASGELPIKDLASLAPRVGRLWATRWWSFGKTYGPACALALLVAGFQLYKIPMMRSAVQSYAVNTTKALHISGLPIPRWARRLYWPGAQQPLPPAMAKFLLDKGALVEGRTTLWSWDTRGSNNSTGTPLMAAIQGETVDRDRPRNRSLETARLLLQRGANVHAQDSRGRTPLMIAAANNSPRAIRLLLDFGANINEQTQFGTPLLRAAQYQWPLQQFRDEWKEGIREQDNAVRFLLENGANPNLRDAAGRTALMVMSLEQRAQKAIELTGKALLKAGADINAKDNKGYTPLMYAIRAKNEAAVEFFLKNGAALTSPIDLDLLNDIKSLYNQSNINLIVDNIQKSDPDYYGKLADQLIRKLDLFQPGGEKQ
jgi:serine/threonine protein kinase